MPNRKADLVEGTTVDLLKDMVVETLTYDNDKEFSNHDRVSKKLGADTYFARSYYSWVRGTNENTNGLIRQFFPKDQALDNLDPEEVQKVEDLLNSRPRKVLGYLTPFEAYARNSIVALHN